MKRAKTAKKDTKEDPFEVSLGTESDDSDDFDDPQWHKRPHRSFPRDRNAARTGSVTEGRGRSPPCLRLRSRNNSVDEKDL